jgi:hypothetical protein
VFRLIRWLAWLVCFAGFVWFGSTVKLGRRTLFGHLSAIFHSREAKDLADGTKEEAHKIAERLREPSPKPALDPVTEKDRDSLDKLVEKKTHDKASDKTHDKPAHEKAHEKTSKR